ncbi:uncharacterized protein F4807DRAFT_68902 [Annulohypoxylon truncatum]|uniref:uncharacterized protein n=1 Tax=Annulohypoxylon truncatum TaxID=327061 RepID=UPI0020086D85|nr:uncharacterized protein F4807DRAFT_68902 [Annulohypoxylon truncatum]KAI1210058.1 hypothetical protein F4807DRAFT_68902 [Annulohypoxylon truncatum]
MVLIFSRVRIRLYLLILAATLATAQTQEDETKVRIAIVGAGITGASAAYHFNSEGTSTSIAITIFEKEAQVGGRIQSKPYFGNYVAEAGAPHFSDSDECLINAVDTLGLRKKPEARPVGLWNGTALLYGAQGLGCAVGVESGSGTLQDLVTEGRRVLFPPAQMRRIINRARDDFSSWTARLWKHGISAPWRFYRAAALDLEAWKHFGSNNSEPFDKLDAELGRIGLSSNVLGPAGEYAGLGDLTYSREAVEPCTRALVSQNLNQVCALAAVISNDPGRVISLWDGNARLVEDMIKRSGAALKTNSQVTQIKPGVDRRYYVETAAGDNNDEFDIVLLAGGPDQDLSSILSDILPPHQIPAPSHYTETHVTHFTTERLLHIPRSKFPEQDVPVPQDISAVYFTYNSGLNGPDLLHASTSVARQRDPACKADPECDEFVHRRVHRVVSKNPLSDEDIARLAGVSLEGALLAEGETLEAKDITGVRRAAWPHAFPAYQKPRHETWGNIELAYGLFYLGGGERLHSSLEMGCRIGRNIAKLIHATRREERRTHASGGIENERDADAREL